MQRFITDERTGIQYELIGDYYYPFNLLTSGKLYEHFIEIDTSACDMAE